MTRLRCAILDDYLNISLKLADWSKIEDRVDVTVFNQPFASPEAAVSALKDFEIILAMRERTPFPRAMFDQLPKLKLLITSGMRNAAIDLAAAKDKGVVVCGTNWPRDPTAALTMGMILELTRNIGRENARMHAGEYLQKHVGIEIDGKTLGVVGLGKLGAKVSTIAKTFGMNVIAWSPNLTAERCKEVGVTYATKEELFSTADIITIHMVLSDRSRGLVGAADLARMKPTSFIVNSARGPIIDEAALVRALKEKKIAGAGLDVFEHEPDVSPELTAMPNVVLTPHLGSAVASLREGMAHVVVDNTIALIEGKPPVSCLNPEVLKKQF